MTITLGELEIIVDDGNWHAYGDPNNFGTHYAMSILNRMGGINEGVTPGVYSFKVLATSRGLEASLFPKS